MRCSSFLNTGRRICWWIWDRCSSCFSRNNGAALVRISGLVGVLSSYSGLRLGWDLEWMRTRWRPSLAIWIFRRFCCFSLWQLPCIGLLVLNHRMIVLWISRFEYLCCERFSIYWWPLWNFGFLILLGRNSLRIFRRWLEITGCRLGSERILCRIDPRFRSKGWMFLNWWRLVSHRLGARHGCNWLECFLSNFGIRGFLKIHLSLRSRLFRSDCLIGPTKNRRFFVYCILCTYKVVLTFCSTRFPNF